MLYTYKKLPHDSCQHAKAFVQAAHEVNSPKGLILGADAIAEFIHESGLDKQLQQLIKAATDEDAKKNVDDEIRRRLLTARFPEKVAAVVTEAVETLSIDQSGQRHDVALVALLHTDQELERNAVMLNLVGKKAVADGIRALLVRIYTSPYPDDVVKCSIALYQMPNVDATARVTQGDMYVSYGWNQFVQADTGGDVYSYSGGEITDKALGNQEKAYLLNDKTGEIVHSSVKTPGAQKITDHAARNLALAFKKLDVDEAFFGIKDEKIYLLQVSQAHKGRAVPQSAAGAVLPPTPPSATEKDKVEEPGSEMDTEVDDEQAEDLVEETEPEVEEVSMPPEPQEEPVIEDAEVLEETDEETVEDLVDDTEPKEAPEGVDVTVGAQAKPDEEEPEIVDISEPVTEEPDVAEPDEPEEQPSETQQEAYTKPEEVEQEEKTEEPEQDEDDEAEDDEEFHEEPEDDEELDEEPEDEDLEDDEEYDDEELDEDLEEEPGEDEDLEDDEEYDDEEPEDEDDLDEDEPEDDEEIDEEDDDEETEDGDYEDEEPDEEDEPEDDEELDDEFEGDEEIEFDDSKHAHEHVNDLGRDVVEHSLTAIELKLKEALPDLEEVEDFKELIQKAAEEKVIPYRQKILNLYDIDMNQEEVTPDQVQFALDTVNRFMKEFQ